MIGYAGAAWYGNISVYMHRIHFRNIIEKFLLKSKGNSKIKINNQFDGHDIYKERLTVNIQQSTITNIKK